MNQVRSFVLFLSLIVAMPVLAQESRRSGSLLEQLDPAKAVVAGSWRKTDDGLATSAMAGSRLMLPIQPTGEYDFRISFTRQSGRDSVALIFVAGGRQASFEVDAWGQHLAGIQNIEGQTLRDNMTRVADQTLANGRKYSAEVRVRKDRVEGWLDGRLLTTYRGDGGNLSLVDLWKLPDAKSLGIAAWDAETVFHSIEFVPVSAERASSNPTTTPTGTPTGTRSAPGQKVSSGNSKTASASKSAAGKSESKSAATSRPESSASVAEKSGRVLIIIANQDFFYREYADPRAELEQAGLTVEVAAGRKETCRPHANSGQGADGGLVQPDLALADADPARYDAILFSGGWGSSMYQFAFNGSYSNPAYNGTPQIKEAANRLINEMVKRDKHVAALCHGVSVLAWSRVNNRSLLAGRRCTGATLPAPQGIYNGRPGQPVSRWNAEANGGRLVAPNSVGNAGTAADDVVIDGKILTGQDDISAREMGRQLARVLKGT